MPLPRQTPPRFGGRSDFAMRVAVLGGIAVFAFAILFFRVWFLQVLSGDEYLAEANENRTRTTRVVAPRGEIRDRDGEVLVGNRASLTLMIDPQKLPEDQDARRAQVDRIAEVADMPVKRVRTIMRDQLKLLPGGMITLKRDVDHDLVFFVAENQDRFPSLQVDRVFVRDYTDLARSAAHMVGSVGEVTEEELEDSRYRNLRPGDTVGKQGLENTYDEYLRGRPGETRIQVDAMGRIMGQLESALPVPGGNLRLSIDGDLQAAGSAAISGMGSGAGFVAMDIESGEVLGLASSPTFDPEVFTRPMSNAEYAALIDENLGAPLFNRVTMGSYPTGSVFKPVTALAALDGGLITPNTIVQDGGKITVGDQEFANARDAVFGPIDLVDSLRVSSDVYYYLLGQRMNGSLQLQNWARRLGYGEQTGIDLPSEMEGLVPTPEWLNDAAAESELYDPWTVGQNIQLAIGQGYQQADPIQVAVSYAAIANGGDVVTPHLGLSIEDAAGRIVREFAPTPKRQVELNPGHVRAIMEGLNQAAQAPGGTAEGVFADFPIPIAGKTGTAERPPRADQAWFVALAPYPNPEIVVAVTIEEGGFGADSAAPVVRQILEQYFADQLAANQDDDDGELTE